MKRLLLTAALLVLCPIAHAAGLPDDIVKRGAIIAAIVPNYPPLDVKDPATNKLTGFDVDLGDAIGTKLGTKIDWQETSFDQMVASVKTGRADIIMSGMTDLASRHDSVSFVDYIKSGPQFFVQASRAGEFTDMLALCGKKVGASRRTSFPKEIASWSEANCAKAGKAAIEVVGTDGSADARTQLRQGRIDAAVQGNETLPYVMGIEPNAYKPLGQAIATQYTGIGVGKDATQLRDALAGALTELIADGTYKKLLDKWQLSDQAIEKVTINAGQ